jgi:hypothetical protein
VRMETTRGCPYECTTAFARSKREKLHSMDVARVRGHIEHSAGAGVRSGRVRQRKLFLQTRRARELLGELKTRRLGIDFF